MSVTQTTHILYLCDKAPAMGQIPDKLETFGYSLDIAHDIQQRTASRRKADYAAVIVDQARSNEAFLATIKLLTERLSPANPPIIIVISPGQEKIAVEALSLGATDYIIRDKDGRYLDLLNAVFAQALRQRRLVRQKNVAEAAMAENMVGIERAKQEWEATIDSLPQLVCLLDRRGQVIRANLTVELWGLAPVTGVRGRRFDELLKMGVQWTAVWESVRQGQAAEFEYQNLSLNRFLSVQVRPLSTQTSRRDKLSDSFAAVVVEDVTRRREAEAALRQYAEELEVHNQDLDAFAHTVAHDLQNPLGLVMGFASALSKHYETLTAEEMSNYLRKILQTSRKMSSIIKELLLMASVRQQDVDLEPLDMNRLLDEARNRLSVLIVDHNAEIILPDYWPIALGYAPWIEEVWVNYISNAIKYGGRPPQLTFGANVEANGMVRFWLHDNGPGLTQEEQRQLFQPFKRLSSRQIHGHGLGLSIVQRIITKLGGEVAVESEGILEKGTVFSFTLPSVEYAILDTLPSL